MLLTLAITAAAAVFGYWQAKQFTQTRLRFVDAVQKPIAPAIAGGAAALIAWALPLVGLGAAVVFGTSVALGVSAGARDIRRRIGAGSA